MSIDTVGSLAQQSYAQIQNRPVSPVNTVAQEPMVQATSFQNTVNKQLNSFAQMTPQQILSCIQAAKNGNNIAAPNSGIASGVVQTLRSTVEKQEQTARKSLVDEASLIELMTATTEAKNVLDTTVKVRDKFMEAFDKVMNMSM